MRWFHLFVKAISFLTASDRLSIEYWVSHGVALSDATLILPPAFLKRGRLHVMIQKFSYFEDNQPGAQDELCRFKTDPLGEALGHKIQTGRLIRAHVELEVADAFARCVPFAAFFALRLFVRCPHSI